MLDTRYMRPRKAALLEKAVRGYEDLSGRLGIARHEGVTLAPLGQLPGVAPAPDLLIDDCDFCSRLTPGVAVQAPRFTGVTLYGGWLRKAWGHFLMNSTARLWPCFLGERVERIVFFADSPDLMPLGANYREFFALAGLLDKIEIISGEAAFECLLVPDVSLEGGISLSREFLLPFRAVREEALGKTVAVETPGRVLLARSRWKNNDRIQFNSSLTESVFASGGFTPVSPESLGLAELVRMMARARELASFSGSTAHNLLFCAPGVRFVSIERAAANNIYQAAIFRLLDIRATLVDAFWQPLLVSSTDNLTIYGLTPEFRRFLSARGWDEPVFHTSPGREFRRYLRVCRRHYGYAPALNEWETAQLPAISEAYHASFGRYAPWLGRRHPVLPGDFLSPRVWVRMLRDLAARRKGGGL